jgi:WD40 repeat protein
MSNRRICLSAWLSMKHRGSLWLLLCCCALICLLPVSKSFETQKHAHSNDYLKNVTYFGDTPFLHGFPIQSLAYSYDNIYLFGAGNNSIVQWERKSGKVCRSYHASGRDLMCMVCSEHHPIFAACDRNGGIEIWNYETHQLLQMKQLEIPSSALAFSTTGLFVATGGTDGSVSMLHIGSGLVRDFGIIGNEITAMRFLSDDSFLCAAMTNGRIVTIDIAKRRIIRQFQYSRQHDIISAISPKGMIVLCGINSNIITLWNPFSKVPYHRSFAVAGTSGFQAVAISPAGDLVIAVSDTGNVIFLNTSTARIDTLAQLTENRTCSSLAMSLDSESLALTGGQTFSIVWNLPKRACLNPQFQIDSNWQLLCVSEEGQYTVVSRSGRATKWKKNNTNIHEEFVIDHFELPRFPSIDCSGKRLAFFYDNEFVVKDLASTNGKNLVTVKDPEFGNAAITGDGQVLLLVFPNNTVKKMPINSIHTNATVYHASSHITEIIPAFRDRVIGVKRQGGFDVVDMKTGKPIWTTDKPIRCAAFSPDEKLLAVIDNRGKLTLREVFSGGIRWTFSDPTIEVTVVAFAFDRTHLALGTSDGRLLYWNLRSDSLDATVKIYQQPIRHLVVSRDSTTLASSSYESPVALWGHQVNAKRVPSVGGAPIGNALFISCWEDLATNDGARVQQAINELANGHPDTVKLIGKEISRTLFAPRISFEQICLRLDSDDFREREHVQQYLVAHWPFFREQVLLSSSLHLSPEVRKRLESTAELMQFEYLPPEEMRLIRVIEVLERIANQEAIELLNLIASYTFLADYCRHPRMLKP